MTYPYEFRDGDAVRYEFFYEPDAVMTHPALGRRVFLLAPDGVITRVLNPAGDALFDEFPPAAEKPPGPARLPLKRGEWNALELSVDSGFVKLALNGEAILRSKIGMRDDTQFGLFHFRDKTASRVRAAVLRMAAATSISAIPADLTARPEGKSTAEDRRVGRAWIGERVLRTERAICRRTSPRSGSARAVRGAPDMGFARRGGSVSTARRIVRTARFWRRYARTAWRRQWLPRVGPGTRAHRHGQNAGPAR